MRPRVTFSQDGSPGDSEQLFAVSPAIPLGGWDIESRESFPMAGKLSSTPQYLCPKPKAPAPLMLVWSDNSQFTSVLFLGCLGGLEHAIAPGFLGTLVDELLAFAPPFVILVFAGGLRHLAPG